jgi:hypothetical protein
MNTSQDLCIWPDCDCEIKCDHINCSPPAEMTPFEKAIRSALPCDKACGPSDYTPTGKCGQNGCVEKPRYRIHFRELDEELVKLIPRIKGLTHHVQIWTIDRAGYIDDCVSVGYMTLERG